jgi:hypothetical protein
MGGIYIPLEVYVCHIGPFLSTISLLNTRFVSKVFWQLAHRIGVKEKCDFFIAYRSWMTSQYFNAWSDIERMSPETLAVLHKPILPIINSTYTVEIPLVEMVYSEKLIGIDPNLVSYCKIDVPYILRCFPLNYRNIRLVPYMHPKIGDLGKPSLSHLYSVVPFSTVDSVGTRIIAHLNAHSFGQKQFYANLVQSGDIAVIPILFIQHVIMGEASAIQSLDKQFPEYKKPGDKDGDKSNDTDTTSWNARYKNLRKYYIVLFYKSATEICDIIPFSRDSKSINV